jgi:hypothetical protein
MKGLNALIAMLKDTLAFKRLERRLHAKRPLRNSFFDLAPIDAADPDGLYQEALNFAMRNSSVRNVAITGPYGSGKTSVIKTFEKSSPYRFLNVSLATFSDPNSDPNATTPAPAAEQADVTVKVERSILQQMLYGAGSGTLPYSRFKRIFQPRWVDLNAILFVGWVAAIGLIYQNHDELLKAISNLSLDWVWIFTTAYALLYFARLVSKSLQASHSLSVKKLSLQSGEIELDGIPESSILNKHLDEIIYFFDENDYDLVVFEDLDRFGNPEIYIKLREINKIINDHPSRKGLLRFLRRTQPLKFVYAIKDDIFLNKDRAKFFDFIVPIIPIINNSNSREILKKCIQAAGYSEGVNDRFIGEVSLYLDDMRLIKNISNEFLIYEQKVGSGNLNVSRLLAAIIYKNSYPKDFECLHHGNGALFEIVEKRTDILLKSAIRIDTEIDALRKIITASEQETSTDILELVKIFWGHLVTAHSEYDISGVYAGENMITAQQLLDWKNFEQIFEEINLSIQGRTRGGYNNYDQRIYLKTSFRALEEMVIPGTTFAERYENVNNKDLKIRSELNSKIEELKDEKSSLARKPLYYLLNIAEYQIKDVTEKHQIQDPRLLNYLIKNGYIDETYHLYISTFHEGRMSRNDWDFILSIRDFRTPEPASLIDNPAEVLEELREEDFGSGHTLNVYLIDHLIDQDVKGALRMGMVAAYISRHLPKVTVFFEAYWQIGKYAAKLTQIIASSFPRYGEVAIEGPLATSHVARILAYIDPAFVAERMNDQDILSGYVAKHAPQLLSENVVFEHGFDALKLMQVKIEQLGDLSSNTALLDYAHQNGLYRLTVSNIKLLLAHFTTDSSHQGATHLFDPDRANYTSILAFGSEPLKLNIDSNINTYLRDVACAMDGNTQESPDTLFKLANHPKINHSQVLKLILQQEHLFEKLDSLPTYLWDDMLYKDRVETTWTNILSFYGLGEYDESSFDEFLQRQVVYEKLSKEMIPAPKDDDKLAKALSWHIVSNETINDESFTALCRSIPFRYRTFPEDFPEHRSIILIDTGVVRLNEHSFNSASGSAPLLTKLIEQNFATYLGALDKYPLPLEVKSLLLASGLSLPQKSVVVSHLTIDQLFASAELTQRTAQIFGRQDLMDRVFQLTLVSYCLANTTETSTRIGILYNFVDILPPAEILSALATLNAPYSDIAKRGTRPRLENNERNKRFAKTLADRKIISSQKPDGEYIKLNTFK